MPQKRITVPCTGCGKPISRTASKLRSTAQPYCGRACMVQPPLVKTCARCGVTFTARKKHTQFCSRSCVNRGRFTPAEERFWPKVDRSGGPDACWPWMGARHVSGHGQFGLRPGVNIRAHAFAWESANGKVADGLFVLHRCDNPPCCNPQHLFTGTQADNMRDMIAKGRNARGERHRNAKLTQDQVDEIRTRWKAGGIRQKALGELYGVHEETIGLIVRGGAWKVPA